MALTKKTQNPGTHPEINCLYCDKILCCVLFLPHANFSFFENVPFSAHDIWDTIHRSLLAKIIPEHRAYTTYNISEARPKRISSKKVMLVFLVKFIVDTHGTDDSGCPRVGRKVPLSKSHRKP